MSDSTAFQQKSTASKWKANTVSSGIARWPKWLEEDKLGGAVGHEVREERQGQIIPALIRLVALTLSELGSHCDQSCLTLCNTLDCNLSDSSVYEIFQARILEWIAISSSRGPSWLKDRTCVSCIFCIAGRFFTHWVIGEAPINKTGLQKLFLEFKFLLYPFLAIWSWAI